MRSIFRIVDVSINTVSGLLVDAGKACAEHPDATVRGVKTKRIQADRNLLLLLRQGQERRHGEGCPGRRWRRVDVDRPGRG